MLIIFDIDDTLIDTSAYITPLKLEKALIKMMDMGAVVKDKREALSDLMSFNQKEASSGDALNNFFEKYKIESCFQEAGLGILYDSFPDPASVRSVPGALEVLEELSKQNTLAVVSIGNEGQQLFKLEKAGLSFSLFHKIFILEEKNKKKYYEKLLEDVGISPQRVVVCGDRVVTDLIPAKEIGCYTVHMQRGRGINNSTKEGVDFYITDLKEILDICSKIRQDNFLGSENNNE